MKFSTKQPQLHIIFRVILVILVSIIFATLFCKQEISAAKSPVIVCIDPGHGGENMGAEWNGYTEKDMTLITALAMKEELEKYDGIRVVITRTDDLDLSLEERVDYAQEMGADFFFCLHYNLSEYHWYYGCENWISAFDNCYARGMDFAKIEMEELTSLGLFDRGIKTRMNSKGTDYYGIIRRATEINMPSIIIEHCHLDHKIDQAYYDTDNLLKQFGIIDATAVAKYYGLSSDITHNDFSNYTYEKTPIPSTVMKPDNTAPEYCDLSLVRVADRENKAYLQLQAGDTQSAMLYYGITYDQGESFEELVPWTKGQDTIDLELELSDTQRNVWVAAFNQMCMWTLSEPVLLPASLVDEKTETEQTANVQRTNETLSALPDSNAGWDDPELSKKQAIHEQISNEEELYYKRLANFMLLIGFFSLLFAGILFFILLKALRTAPKRTSGKSRTNSSGGFLPHALEDDKLSNATFSKTLQTGDSDDLTQYMTYYEKLEENHYRESRNRQHSRLNHKKDDLF